MYGSNSYSDLVKRFAKLPLLTRFHLCEELLVQLQPGASPEQAAQNTIDRLTTPEQKRRLEKLLAAAEAQEEQ
jgi:hypothetical protein